MKRRAFLVGVAVGVSGCMGGPRTSTADDIGMTASAFVPAEFETTVGETVTWENTDLRGHTVTAYDAELPAGAEYFASGGYRSEQEARAAFAESFGGLLEEGEIYRHTFEVPGEYGYFCIPHERGGMRGRVIVREN